MTLREAVPLDCDVHKVFLFFFPPLLVGQDGQSGLELGISLTAGQLGSDKTLAR